jgi:predicted RNA-binding Zn-ribbon protein involved in translation (DUF1610 family)
MPESHPADPPTGVPQPAADRDSVHCPKCGNADLSRIPRRPLDRVLSWVRPVYRFRCEDPSCGWEGTLPQKWFPKDWHRRYYRY